jgi:hypothetical protein
MIPPTHVMTERESVSEILCLTENLLTMDNVENNNVCTNKRISIYCGTDVIA